LTFAVVDKTAVVTLVTGFVMEGYANKLGLAFDTKSNLRAWDERLAPRLYASAFETYPEVSIQTNDTRWFESQTGTVRQDMFG
jgi:hypothetical protein